MKTCWIKYLFYLCIALLGLSSMVSACGKKGDLYHPQQTQEPRQ